MNVDNLILFQKERDKSIKSKQHIEGRILRDKKMLSFQVSLGELASVTNCNDLLEEEKEPDMKLVLEKYTRSLSSLISIGIENNFTDITVENKEIGSDITNQFLNLFVDTNDLLVSSSKDNFITLLEDFLSLGMSLKLDIDTIRSEYLDQYYN